MQNDWRCIWTLQQWMNYMPYLWITFRACQVIIKSYGHSGFLALPYVSLFIEVLLSLPKDCCPQHLSILVNIFVCIWFSKSSWCHPSLLPLDLWHSGALLLTTWSVCCAAWLRALEHISKLSVCLLLTSSLVLAWALCRARVKGLSFWPQISGESELASSKGGLLTVIYSPHRDKVRHGHCLCTWAFIKRPGWALCRRHSNVQGAD